MKCPNCNVNNPSDAHFCKKCSFPLKDKDGKNISQTKTLNLQTIQLKKGSVFANRYEVVEELGHGGMGNVYRVFDKKIEEEVALKLIRMHIASDKNAIERFRNELKIARKISHKNVCRMYDLNEYSGVHYITMEYVEGEDLKTLLEKKKNLSSMETVDIGIQISKGLMEAHELGIVHRDLKPQNIMIDKKGNAHILDFGIACSLETSGVTEVGKTVGTPKYMSPEQVSGQDLDQRSDIYSLGIVLYELLVGCTPFEGNDMVSVAVRHKTEAPKIPKEIASMIPKRLSDLVLKCLEKDKTKRYQSAREFLSDLNEIKKEIFQKGRFFEDEQRKKGFFIQGMGSKKKRAVGAVLFVIVLGAVLMWISLKNTGFARSKEIAIHTEPEGANIYYNDALRGQDEWHYLGMTPIEKIEIPKRNLLWRAEKKGYKTINKELICKQDVLSWKLVRAKGISEIISVSEKDKTLQIKEEGENDFSIGMTGKIFSAKEKGAEEDQKNPIGSFVITKVNKDT